MTEPDLAPQEDRPRGSSSNVGSRWAALPLDTPAGDFLAAVRSQIPVSLIATPRASLQCRPRERGTSVGDEHELATFDQVPLTEGDRIVAVFVRGEGVVELREDLFMAADAPLLTFLKTADRQRFRFLMEGEGISGLVTLSDIQKLPVYSVLFSLVVAAEMLLMDWIRKASGGDDEVWRQHLSSDQRKAIERYWNRAKKESLEIDRLAVASLEPEIQAAAGMGLFSGAEEQHKRFTRLKKLRDRVSHAMELALSPEQALTIPGHVRDAHVLIDWLQEKINERKA